MRRRNIIAGLASTVAAWPLAARATACDTGDWLSQLQISERIRTLGSGIPRGLI
jgi:hypothetical protein